MRTIAVCGARGLIGTSLIERLQNDEWRIHVVGRDASRLRGEFPRAAGWLNWDEFADSNPFDLDALVNLAGAGVMDRVWTDAYKQTMTSSRIEATQRCTELVERNPRIRLLNASSVHAYGIYAADHPAFGEGDPPRAGGADCYLYELISQWERSLRPAVDAGASVATLRLGVVLARDGGSLRPMLPVFRAFLGGPQGSGRQIISWITLNDVIGAIRFLLDNPQIRGPVNLVAPEAIANAEIMRQVGKALGRPSRFSMPSFFARSILGEAANELVLAGQRVEPRVLLDYGYEFADTDIEVTLRSLLS